MSPRRRGRWPPAETGRPSFTRSDHVRALPNGPDLWLALLGPSKPFVFFFFLPFFLSFFLSFFLTNTGSCRY